MPRGDPVLRPHWWVAGRTIRSGDLGVRLVAKNCRSYSVFSASDMQVRHSDLSTGTWTSRPFASATTMPTSSPPATANTISPSKSMGNCTIPSKSALAMSRRTARRAVMLLSTYMAACTSPTLRCVTKTGAMVGQKGRREAEVAGG